MKFNYGGTIKIKTEPMMIGSRNKSVMHDWAASNNWSSRPTTKAGNNTTTPYGWSRPSTNARSERITVKITGLKPESTLRRCKTNLDKPQTLITSYKPKKRTESCTLEYMRYLEISNKESEGKLKKTINVLSMQRSKSDLDVRETPVSMGGSLFGGGMFRERSQILLPGGTDGGRRESISQGNKAEMKIGVAVIPRKGLISLSTTDEPQKPLGALGVSGQRGQSMGHPETNTGTQKPKQKSLIKNKTILEALKQGTKQLEDEEAHRHQEEEMTKSLGEYTIMDLQSNILSMVDHQSSRKPLYETPTGSGRKQPAITPKPDKPLTLPAIKNFNPFST